MAYQIAFDLYESATQQFLGRVLQALRATAPIPGALMVKPIVKPAVKASTEVSTEPAAATTAETENSSSTPAPEEKSQRSVESLNAEEREQQERVDALSSILGGEISIDLHLQFLIRSNHTDMLILKNTKRYYTCVYLSYCHRNRECIHAFWNY